MEHLPDVALVPPASSSSSKGCGDIVDWISDEQVRSACGILSPQINPKAIYRAARFILEEMLSLSHRGISSSAAVDRAESLLQEDPGLESLLVNAWHSQSFQDIWKLQGLRLPRTTPETSPQRKATEKAWKIKYVGQHQHLLLRIIDNMQATRENADFANTVPIIQSSGTGKSRTVHELAQLVFTIPFNLREDNTSGFPDPDSSVRVLLTTKGTSNQVRVLYLRFLTVLFGEVMLAIDQIPSSPDPLALRWRTYLETPRAENSKQTNRQHLYLEVCKEVDVIPGTQERHVAEESAKIAAAKLVAKVSHSCQRTGVRVLLYFDEAHTLLSPSHKYEGKKTQRTFYSLLCWSLNVLNSSPIFTIFLSTNSNLANVAPSALHHHPSDRGPLSAVMLQPPITEMPFDCLPNGQPFAIPEDLSLDRVCEVEFMTRFGRPLFWTRWDAGDYDVRKGMIDFAIGKLTRKGRGDNDLNEPALYAMLSTRILLEFEPFREPTTMERELVEAHMRIAYSVPQHREYIHTGSSSEPILAEAAARAMYHWSHVHASNPFGLIEVLAKFSKNGLISKGEWGELVARLLLTLAHDRALDTTYWNAIDGSFSEPVPLTAFLSELFTDHWTQLILDSRPDNQPGGATLSQAFEHAYVRFTHFVKAADRCAVTTNGASAGIIRGFAFQCSNRQKSVNIVIPVVLCKKGTSEKGLAEAEMTGVLISITNRGESISPGECSINASELGFFPPDCRHDLGSPRPYIAITMELGIEPRSELADLEAVGPKPPVDRPRREKQAAELRLVHPRYSISATSCSSKIYRDVDEDLFAQLLGSQRLLEEHPRQSPECLGAVRQLKPFVAIGNSAFGWVKDSFLSNPVIPWGVEISVGEAGGEDQDGDEAEYNGAEVKEV